MAAIASLVTTTTPIQDIDYPTSDGELMSETDLHLSLVRRRNTAKGLTEAANSPDQRRLADDGQLTTRLFDLATF